MSQDSFKPLALHKLDYHPGDPLDWCHSARLREQLMEEIRMLDAQLEALEACDQAIDYSLRQTCREMIHSRQQLFRQIRR